MSYRAAIESLKAMTPELHTNPGQPRRKFSLVEFEALMRALGDPQRCFPSVLIAGTNGKGSTASSLASILRVSGMRVGLYTSPHLERVNERIRIGAEEIGDDDFGEIFFRVLETAKRLVQNGALPQPPSFFEILTALMMLYFAEQKVELAVLEVGMGGRLDATNIVDPLLSVITDISLDHTEWLGSTLAAITREKAGILRRGKSLITLPQDPEVSQTLSEICLDLGVQVIDATRFMGPVVGAKREYYQVEVLGCSIDIASPLRGRHQKRNIALAICAAEELAMKSAFPVSAKAIQEGIRDTCWPGRLEVIEKGGVTWILDVAHNPAGATALCLALKEVLSAERYKTIVFSCLRDKPLGEMAKILFPLFDEVILAPIHSARATSIEDLKVAGLEAGSLTTCAISVEEALLKARELAKGSVVVVSGSVYLVGEARSLLLNGGIE